MQNLFTWKNLPQKYCFLVVCHVGHQGKALGSVALKKNTEKLSKDVYTDSGDFVDLWEPVIDVLIAIPSDHDVTGEKLWNTGTPIPQDTELLTIALEEAEGGPHQVP